jgi:hypothetical protein
LLHAPGSGETGNPATDDNHISIDAMAHR